MALINPNPQISKPTINRTKVADLVRELLIELGQDADSDGLRDTPRRVADYWHEFLCYQSGTMDTTFAHDGFYQSDQMIVVKGIEVWSLCEHHLLPFTCTVAIGYIPNGKVLGLSKFGRIAHYHAHSLQIQERLTSDIADSIGGYTNSPDVGVYVEGVHLCMSMRGIKSPATMITQVLRGAFIEDSATRNEFLSLVKGG